MKILRNIPREIKFYCQVILIVLDVFLAMFLYYTVGKIFFPSLSFRKFFCSAAIFVSLTVGIITYFMLRSWEKANRELAENQDHLEAITSAMPDVCLVLDRTGRYCRVMTREPELLASPGEQLVGNKIEDELPPQPAQKIMRGIEKTLSTKAIQKVDYLLDVPAGRCYFQAYISPLSDNEVVFVARDITDLKETEEELKLKEAAIKTSLNGVAFWDEMGIIEEVNNAFLRLWGFDSPGEVEGRPIAEFLADSELAELILNSLKQQNQWKGELVAQRKDGSTFDVQLSVDLIRDSEGHPRACMGIFADITERKLAEAELRKFKRAVEQSPAIVVITDPGGEIEYLNPRFTEITGYKREEILGKNSRFLQSGAHSRQFYWRLWMTIKAGEVWRGEFQNKKKNGELYWEDAAIAPVKNEAGEITHFIKVAEDVTEEKKAKGKLEKALREKETLLQEIHHRVKNNMQVISSLLNMQARVSDQKIVEKALQDSRNRVRSMALIHEKIYQTESFSEIEAKQYLGELVSALKSAHATAGFPVLINFEVEPGLSLGIDRAIPCGLVVNELVTNALEHAFTPEQDKGVIEIEFRVVKAGDFDYILTITDNGTGLPLDYDSGDSLGLELVETLVHEKLEGEMKIERETGSKFVIKF